MQNICCLLASKRMFKELCECNEHRETAGFEVRVHAEVRDLINDKQGNFYIDGAGCMMPEAGGIHALAQFL